ncbi:MAG: GNAT family N-acetyltransferase [Magnetovibrionaceae bacterium]
MAMFDDLFLRPAEPGDSGLLFDWQHAPGVRRYFRHPEPPKRAEHVAWFDSTLMRWDRLLLIACTREGQAVGMVRLDLADRGAVEVSVLVAPEHQGLGWGVKALLCARHLAPAAMMVAEVHEENKASARLFEKAGYRQSGESEGPFRAFISPPSLKQQPISLLIDLGANKGTGHVTRAATLAGALQSLGAPVLLFLPEAPEGPALPLIEGLDHRVFPLSVPGATVLLVGSRTVVVDHYGLDAKALSQRLKLPLYVFDDFNRWGGTVGVSPINGAPALDSEGPGLLGAEYQMLRRDLPAVRPAARNQQPVRKLLVSLGSTEVPGLTQPLCDLLSAWAAPKKIEVLFVRGSFAPYPDARPAIRVIEPQPSLSDLIERADIGLLAAGQTLIECLACGLPTIGLMVADNQLENLVALVAADLCLDGGDARPPIEDAKGGWQSALIHALDRLVEDAALRQGLSGRGPARYDRLGAERLARRILSRLEDVPLSGTQCMTTGGETRGGET